MPDHAGGGTAQARRWAGKSDILDRLDLSDLEREVAAFCRFFASMPTNPAEAMHGTVSHMHALCAALARHPRELWRSRDIQDVLQAAIRLQAASPFVRRLREWPRGYPGDFETIELLVQGAELPTGADPRSWIDWYALNTVIGQQHRNKIWWQYQRMSAVTPANILALGCGGGADFNLGPHRFERSHIVLLDLDQDALLLAEDRLRRYCDVRTICADVRRGLRKAQDDGPFERVVCGGVFDYLDDRMIVVLLKDIRERLLSFRGSVLFTNIAEGNPFRCWMEAIANWHLIHRSEADIARLVAEAGFDLCGLRIARDATGLTLLVEVALDPLA